MPDYIAICLPKKLVTILLGNSHLTLDKFLSQELPLVINQYEDQIQDIHINASSPDVVKKILTWKNPDLYAIHIQEQPDIT